MADRTCWRCGGTGEVYNSEGALLGIAVFHAPIPLGGWMKTCTECNGTGKIHEPDTDKTITEKPE